MPDAAARQVVLAMSEKRMGDLSARYAAGDLDLGAWQQAMREELRRAYALQTIAGNDGKMPTADDWRRIESSLRDQYSYLVQFRRDLTTGEVEGDAIASRSALYARSAQSAYWKQATGGADLPAQPCDGSTFCKGNCGCEWVNIDGAWHWKRGKADSCDDCIHNEQTWNPYVPESEAA